MKSPDRTFWGRVELVVMAAACGTLLGTGLLAGAISLESSAAPMDAVGASASGAGTSTPLFTVFRRDGGGAYRAVVVIDGVPLDMIVDTGAARSLLSEQDARRVFRARDAERNRMVVTLGGAHLVNRQEARSVEIGGRTLLNVPVGLAPAATVSVIGQDWLAQLRPIVLDPREAAED
ncbi:MAG: retroviral-like aspartic protease family protein [Sphingomonadales bacterium]|nr:retroviral-like aspartic protease family protein [Sphingomonadales bacterium]